MKHVLAFVALAFHLAVATAGWAQTTVEGVQSRTTLVSERTSVAAGTTVWLGLTIVTTPGWHTYWRTPGDSGLPTTIRWDLPPGVTAGEIHWPPPERIATGDLMNFGYHDRVTLPVPLKIEPGVTGDLTVAADATWLVCADVCIPEDGHFELKLTAGAANGRATADADAIAAARASVPGPATWPVRVTRSGAAYVLELGPGLPEGTTGAAFFPYGDGAILNAAPQPFEGDGDSATLRVAAGPTPPARLDGVVVLDGTSRAAGEISADVPPPGAAPDMTIAVALLFAVLGGLILNVMPCVLPVLFMKALAVVGRREDAGMLRRDALIYTAGVITAFTILVSILLALRAAGAAIGWGFQLQNPIVVATLAAAMLGLGLNLSGVFSIGSGIAGVGQGLAARPGSWGSFFTGVLAVVVATPCTAPFMGAALGFALTQPPLAAVAVFEGLAIGLALPYLAIAFVPGLARLLPRPGPWMERLKQILAFGLYGAMAWLLWVLSQQLDAGGLALVLVGLIAVAFAAWSWGLRGEARGWTPAAALALLVAIVAIAGLQGRPTPATAAPLEAGAEPFSTERLAALRQAQKPVFVNFTAAWCITCLLNERVALSQPDVRAALQERGITYLKADWTNRNPEITAALHQLGRDGVPVYVYYPVNGAPEVLPQILTPALVLAALDNS